MNNFIGLFLPSVIALYLYTYKIKKQSDIKSINLLIDYFLNVLVVNILNFIILIYVLKKPMFEWTNSFTLKYLCLSIAILTFLNFIYIYFKKNIIIHLRIEKSKKEEKQQKKKFNKFNWAISLLLILISALITIVAKYLDFNFGGCALDAIIFNLFGGLKKANLEVFGKALLKCIIPYCLLVTIILFPLANFKKSKYILDFSFKSKEKSFQISPNTFLRKHKIFYSFIMVIISIAYGIQVLKLVPYLKSQKEISSIFENHYIPANKIDLEFPKKKRNLIYIFLESMESSLMTKSSGGGLSNNTLIPELEELAKKNINFSNTPKIGGAIQVYGVGWTVAGMVAQTAGIPLKLNIDGNSYSGYSSFLPGVYALGDILAKEGYNLEIMMGSDANFGGRYDYFTKHGNYQIFDVNKAIKVGKMKNEDRVWWGFSDDNLFAWSKEEIMKLAKKDKPFNYIMLTADTHFLDGYLSPNAQKIYANQYENVFAYSSILVNEFLKWLKKQDFYKDTTIVIVGDHLGMQTSFYQERLLKDYQRTVYNVFINSAINSKNTKNRTFSTMDIFPTVLASMGVKIQGNRLGLGTNLFSNQPTLLEEYGFDFINNELAKKSNYYNKYLLQGDYLEMGGKKQWI